MRTRAARTGIAVATVVAVVALFFAFARDEGEADTAITQPQGAQVTTDRHSSAGSTTTQPTSAPGATAAPPPAPKFERIVVRGGKPVGGVKRLEYEHGERVQFSVRTDVADEVHVHGFDITKDLPANRRVRFAFTADIEGVFEVELHDAHAEIAELRIGP